MSHPLSKVFSFTTVPNREEVAVVLRGEFELASAGQLEREVKELAAVGFARIVIDLSDVEFLDSAGLHTLMALRNDAKRRGHELVLVPGRADVQRIFQITGTGGLFDWHVPTRVPAPLAVARERRFQKGSARTHPQIATGIAATS